MSKDSKKIAVGALLAAGAGYVVGILTAPKSGKETREDVKNAAVKAKREAEKKLKKLHSDLNSQLERAKIVAARLQASSKKELDTIVSSAIRAKEKARQMLTAIHDGDVEDKDLKKAIDEVSQAMEHLRTFLDKNE